MTSTTIPQATEGEHVCEPMAVIPAWWSAFLFHTLNPRQICMYAYLVMLGHPSGECSPTIEQIREDLGLYSSSMVFDALATLDDLGFVTRERQVVAGVRSRRNLYRRPPCVATLLRLLERGRIDAWLHPANPSHRPASPESETLIDDGLREILGDGYADYASASDERKRDVLVALLKSALAS
jgi:hypothetical protein